MESFEGILAIGGFWLCVLLAIMKKPLMAYIEKSKVQESQDVKAISQRMQQLESAVATMGKDVQEMKDTSEFAHKLLIDSAQHIAEAHRLLALNAQQLANSQTLLTESAQPLADPVKLLTTNVPLMADLGKVINDHTVSFERLLPVPVDRVWQYLTEPEYLRQWLAVSSMEPRVGGRVELNFDVEEMPERKEKGTNIRGLISCFEPQSALAFSWIDTANNLESAVSFQLIARGEQTSVIVTHSRLPKNRMHEFMAGWHTHLDVLKARLTNAVPPQFGKRFREVVQTYAVVVAASVVVSGAPAQAAGSQEQYQVIQTERSHLLSKYDAVWKDADNLKHEIAVIKRDNSPEASRAADRLDRQLADEYNDLRQLELSIRDLDKALI
jgi:uncharacterized protein YndB with AHSA1/START domain/outer membrane murein-binding lipoprotein Lpp